MLSTEVGVYFRDSLASDGIIKKIMPQSWQYFKERKRNTF
jgi:hypothetical protein